MPSMQNVLKGVLALTLMLAFTQFVDAAQSVKTIAGSGRAGSADGSALSASFVLPVAVAYDFTGDLYVADAGAHRIRVLHAGVVRTLAGSTAGFRNGSARSAQFNRPSAVLVRPDGVVLVADTLNHCIRAIDKGQVTAFAGRCTVDGKLDGPNDAATFHLPMSLAIDVEGNVYVGDFNTGVRKISRGSVTTVALPPSIATDITSVSTIGLFAALQLAIVNRDGIYTFQPSTGKTSFYRAGGYGPRDSALSPWVFMDGYRSIGYPYALVPLGTLDFVYTDIWTNSVRAIHQNYTTALAGNMSENAMAEPSVFSAPLGIAHSPTGGFAVADAGNRKIRLVPPDNAEQQAGANDLAAAKGSYRIVLIGNSHVLYNSDFKNSPGGVLERILQSNWRELGIPQKPRVFTIKLYGSTAPMASYIQNILSSGLAESVIWQFNSATVVSGSGKPEGTDLAADTSWWLGPTTSAVKAAAQSLKSSGTYFLPVLAPLPFEVSSSEATWLRTFDLRTEMAPQEPLAQNYAATHAALLGVLQRTGVPVLDLWQLMQSEENKPVHQALFTTRDVHYSNYGNEFAGTAIARALEAAHPWRK